MRKSKVVAVSQGDSRTVTAAEIRLKICPTEKAYKASDILVAIWKRDSRILRIQAIADFVSVHVREWIQDLPTYVGERTKDRVQVVQAIRKDYDEAGKELP